MYPLTAVHDTFGKDVTVFGLTCTCLVTQQIHEHAVFQQRLNFFFAFQLVPAAAFLTVLAFDFDRGATFFQVLGEAATGYKTPYEVFEELTGIKEKTLTGYALMT